MARTKEVGLRIALCVIAAAACTQQDTRVPTARLQEDIVVTAIPDSAGAEIDLEVGLGGTMFVLLPALKHVRVFQPAGGFSHAINVVPEGFVHPVKLGSVRGYLSVYDSATRRLHLFQPNGQIVQSVQLQARNSGAGPRRIFHQMLRDGSVLIREVEDDQRGRLLRIAGERTDTIVPLDRSATVLFSPTDGMVLAIKEAPSSADSSGFTVTKLNLVGDTLFNTIWRVKARRGEQPGFTAAFLSSDGNVHVQAGNDVFVFSGSGQPQLRVVGLGDRVRLLAAQPNYAYGLRGRGGTRELVRFKLQKRTS